MSRTIDEQVVKMSFDSSKFNSGIEASLKVLDKLKKSLKFEKAGEDLQKSIGNVDLSKLDSALDAVTNKFSVSGTMIDQTLRRITDSAINTGKAIASALTVDPVMDGLHEYETQMNAVQTILSNTRSKGTTIDEVNLALSDLNTYADKTIYNFTEMTRNIGTFTAAGVGLKTATQSIKGIANLAAVSGSSAQQASTAMYQLSQAMAAGKVQLMDWNSVVNAGMGGEVFQEALKRTSRMMGTGVDEAIATYGTFRDSLTKGAWLTTDVLTETLKQISGAYTEADLLAKGYSKEQAKEILDLATDAEKAATMVKTFTQLIDTLKEALGSGWTQTWQYIIGDFEEAREMWTSVSDVLGAMINKSSDARNAILKNWKDIGGRTVLLQGLEYAFKDLLAVMLPIKEAFQHVFPPITGKQLLNITKKFRDLTNSLMLTQRQFNDIKNIAIGVFGVIKIALTGVSAVFNVFTKTVQGFIKYSGLGLILNLLLDFAGGVGQAIDLINTALTKGFDPLTSFMEIGKIFPELTPLLDKMAMAVDAVQAGFAKLSNAVKPALDTLKSIGETALFVLVGGFFEIVPMLNDVIDAIINFGKSIASGFMAEAAPVFSNLSSAMHSVIDTAAPLFISAFTAIDETLSSFIGNLTSSASGVEGFGNKIGSVLGGVIGKIQNGAKNAGGFLGNLFHFDDIDFSSILDSIKGFIDAAKSKFESLQTIVSNAFAKIKSVAQLAVNGIGDAFSSTFSSLTSGKFILGAIGLTGVFTSILSYIQAIKVPLSNVGDLFKDLKETIGSEGVFGNIGKVVDGIKDAMSKLNDVFTEFQKSIQINYIKAIASTIGKLALSLILLGLVRPDRLVSSGIAMEVLFKKLSSAVEDMSDLNEDGIASIRAASVSLMKISGAVLILTMAVKNLSNVDPFNLTVGVFAIIKMLEKMVEIVDHLKNINESDAENIGTVAKALKSVGVSLLLLSVAVRLISGAGFNAVIGTAAVIFLLKSLTAQMKEISKLKLDNFGKSMFGLMEFAMAINMLVAPIAILGHIDIISLAKGLGSVGVLILAIGMFLKKSDPGKMGAKSGAGLLLMAMAMTKLSTAVAKMGALPVDQLAKGVASIGALMVAIGLMNRISGKAQSGIGELRGSILVIALAVRLLVPVVTELGKLPIDKLRQGLLGLSGALAELTLTMLILSKMGSTSVAGALGMIAVAGAVSILAGALTVIGSNANVWGALAALGIALVELTVGLYAMAGAIPGALALAVAAGGITLLAPALMLLGSIPWSVVLNGLAVLGVSMLGVTVLSPFIAVAAAAFAALGAGLLVLSAAIAVGALAFTAITASLAALVAVIVTLSTIGPAGAAVISEAITLIITSTASAVANSMSTIAEGISSFVSAIAQNGPVFAMAIKTIIPPILSALGELVPQLFTLLSTILTNLLTFIETSAPAIAQSAINALTGILTVIRDNIGEVTVLAVEVIVAFVNGIAASLGIVITAAVDLVIAFINGVGDAFATRGPQLGAAIGNLLSGIVTGILGGIFELFVTFFGGLGTAFMNFVQNAIPAIGSFFSSAWQTICTFIQGAISGLGSFIKDFYESGKNFVLGIINGIGDFISDVADAAKSLGQSILDAVANVLKIHSPSREGYSQGAYYDQGVANGISETSGVVTDAANSMAQDAVNEADSTLTSGLNSIIAKFKEKGKGILAAQNETQDDSKKSAKGFVDDWLANLTKVDNKSSETGKGLKDDAKSTVSGIGRQMDEGNKKGKKAAGTAKETTEKFVASDAQLWKNLYESRKAYIGFSKDEMEGLSKFEEDTLKKTDDIVKSYTDNWISNAKKMASQGLFSKVSEKTKVTADELKKNLQDQITQINDYSKVMNSLNTRISSAGLKEAINEMGVESLGELEALNSMTDEQLTEYTQLYDRKYAASLNNIKAKAQNELSNLYGGVKIDIDQFAATFDGSLKSIEAYFSSDASKAKFAQAGTNVTAGIAEGMKDQNALNSINDAAANVEEHTVDKALPVAFDSHSPAKTTIPEGEYITEGIAEGMVDETALAAIRESANTLMQEVMNAFKGVSEDKGKGGIQIFTETILSTLTTALNGMKNETKNFKEIATDYAKNIIAGYNSKAKDIKAAVKKMTDIMVKDLKAQKPSFNKVGKDLIDGLAKGLNEGASKLATSAHSVTNKILASLKISNDKLIPIGENYTKGLIEGIKSKSSDLYKVIEKMIKEALETARKTAKIHSPSRETFAIGSFMGKGLINGISVMGNAVCLAAKSVSEQALDGFGDILSTLSGLEDIDATPVIAPVLDLSNIQNGVDEMRNMFSNSQPFSMAASISDNMAIRRMNKAADNANLRAALNSVNASNLNTSAEIAVLQESINGLKASLDSQTNPDYTALQTAIENLSSSVGTQNTATFTNTFNIQATDPKSTSAEISRELQKMVNRRNAVWA